MAYNAGEKAEEVDGALTTLSDAIHDVQVTDGFDEVLSQQQREDVECAAINLSASVTKYLAMAIEYFTDRTFSSLFLQDTSNLTVGRAKTVLIDKTEFVDAKAEIDIQVQKYHNAMGSLTATMGAELLKHDKEEKRQKILQWLGPDTDWNRHKELSEKRVMNTGKWVLQSPQFQNWWNESSQSFVCYGIRIFLHNGTDLFSWSWQIVYYLSSR